jgi:uncharacterized lipoprotein YmbA
MMKIAVLIAALMLAGCATSDDGGATLGLLLLGAAAQGYGQAHQPAPLVVTSCTTNAGIINCLSF